jgi:hypothetical protein
MVFFSGYTLVWYGWTTIRGPGLSFMDLVAPSRIANVDKWLTGPAPAAQITVTGSGSNVTSTKGSLPVVAGTPKTTTAAGGRQPGDTTTAGL